MPYPKREFEINGIYHLNLRAVDDNLIFKDDEDKYRGIFGIYEFNNNKPVNIWHRRQQRKKEKLLQSDVPQRDLLVEVLSFCLMPNHIHLLVRQIRDGGISKFVQKFGAGLALYFNKKYGRKGHIFQNRFYSVYVENDNQLMAVFNYINTNPISLVEPSWKENGIKNPEEVIKFLEQYRWSSYLDYLGIKNFPSLINQVFLLDIMKSPQNCRDFVKNWVTYKSKMRDYKNLFLD